MLFAHCVSKHSSTKYSPLKLLYHREPVLPIGIKYKLSSQFVTFKPLVYCFEKTIVFDVKASFASRPRSRLIRWYNKPGDTTKEFSEKAIQFNGTFHGLTITNWSAENSDPDGPFDKNIFDAVLASSDVIREKVHRQTGEHIKKTQKKQQRDYESRNKSPALNEVLLRNNKLKDWKETYFQVVRSDITTIGLVTLKNRNDKELKKV